MAFLHTADLLLIRLQELLFGQDGATRQQRLQRYVHVRVSDCAGDAVVSRSSSPSLHAGPLCHPPSPSVYLTSFQAAFGLH